jgi:hypothetical protein
MNVAYLSGTIVACRIRGRRPDIGHHDLAGPTCSGKGSASRPRNVPATRPLQGFHRRSIESVWLCDPEQPATDGGARRPLRPDQQDARRVLATNCRVLREGRGRNNRHLLRAEQDDPRAARNGQERQGDRSTEGLQRSRAQPAAGVRLDKAAIRRHSVAADVSLTPSARLEKWDQFRK